MSASLASFQARCRFDYAVLRARYPRQVITPGDGGTGGSSPPSPYHRVNIVVAPLSRQAIDVLPAVLSRGRIIVSILIRFLGTSQTAFFSLHRGFSRYDIDCPPCPTRCPPCPPVTINLLACFWTRHKKGGQPVLSPVTVPLIKAIVVTSDLVLACIF